MMQNNPRNDVFITGHRNPDTDSIIASIAYAEYKNKMGNSNYIPVRLGELNRETKFILDYFQIPLPRLIETVKMQVRDLNYDTNPPIEKDVSLKMAWNLMKKNNVNSLVIVDENGSLEGVVTVANLTESYMDVWDNLVLGKSGVTLHNLLETLNATPIFIPKEIRPISGKMAVVSMMPEDANDFLEENDVVIVGNLKHAQEVAISNKSSVMIVVSNSKVDEDILKMAEENQVTIISTPFDTFTAARVLPQSVPISFVMTKDNIVTFSLDDFLNDIKTTMADTRFRAYPILNNEKKVVGTISRYHLISAKKKKVILVDHNERTQSVDGLEDAEILEIIDHHRVADVATGSPIYFRNEPVGSTSTIIASIFFENGVRPSKKIAGLLCAAIISDTLLFKSPTSTNTDRMNLERLAKIADLNIDEFAMEMFKVGTSLEGKTPQQLLKQDFKVFTVADQKMGMSQVYSVDATALKDMKNELLELMEQTRKQSDYTLFGLLITDIFKESSELIVVGPSKDLIEKAFNKKIVDNSIELPGVLSRKKQVIPVVTNVIMNSR